MSEQVLDCPTVAQFIEALQALQPNAPIIIEDADTGWTIDKIHIFADEKQVALFGKYDEMHG